LGVPAIQTGSGKLEQFWNWFGHFPLPLVAAWRDVREKRGGIFFPVIEIGGISVRITERLDLFHRPAVRSQGIGAAFFANGGAIGFV
jgi:GNAT superfamily N-acetyltransferase